VQDGPCRRYALFLVALTFAQRALCAFEILARALAETCRFLSRPTLFFPPKILMAVWTEPSCLYNFNVSFFNASRMFIGPRAKI
jgi:hypothetical protein